MKRFRKFLVAWWKYRWPMLVIILATPAFMILNSFEKRLERVGLNWVAAIAVTTILAFSIIFAALAWSDSKDDE